MPLSYDKIKEVNRWMDRNFSLIPHSLIVRAYREEEQLDDLTRIDLGFLSCPCCGNEFVDTEDVYDGCECPCQGCDGILTANYPEVFPCMFGFYWVTDSSIAKDIQEHPEVAAKHNFLVYQDEDENVYVGINGAGDPIEDYFAPLMFEIDKIIEENYRKAVGKE